MKRREVLPAYYQAMVDASASTGLPKRFSTDLTTHDRAALAARGAEASRIGWFLYESGTHLVILAEETDSLSRDKAQIADHGDRWFIGERGRLREVSKGEWIDAMSRDRDYEQARGESQRGAA